MRPQTRSSRNIRPPLEGSALHSVPAITLKRPRTESTFEVYRDEVPAPSKKKSRHRMTDLQLERLETLYQYATHPTRQEKEDLGKEVGMDGRTVTVWFQNRRQLAKKASETEVGARRYGSQPLPQRQPLAVVPTAANRQSSETPAIHLSDPSSSQVILHPTPVHAQSTAKRPKMRKITSSQSTRRLLNGSAKEVVRPHPLQRAHTFHWESNQHGMNDAGTSDSDTTDEDVDILNTDDEILPQHAVRLDIKDIHIPAELSARFSDDVVFGASLLLSFQNSAI